VIVDPSLDSGACLILCPGMRFKFFAMVLSIGANGLSAATAIGSEQSCPQGKHFVRTHSRAAYVRADGTRVSAAYVKATCRVRTKVEEKWSPRLYASFPASHSHPQEKAKAWSEGEKQRLFEAFSDFPEVLLNSKVDGFVRAARSVVPKNPATWDDGYIVLYDEAFGAKQNLARIVAHEMAHQLFSDFSEENRDEYRWAANWFAKSKKRKDFFGRSDGYVQDDGRVSPDEDFANNVEYLLFDEATLLKKTPQAHRWLKSHFGDKLKIERIGEKK
jgi:hypothetical protein